MNAMKKAAILLLIWVIPALFSPLRAGEGTLLKLKWTKGRHYFNSMGMNMTTKMTTPFRPKPVTTDTTMSMDSKTSVLEALPEGGYRLDTEQTDLKMDVKNGTEGEKPKNNQDPLQTFKEKPHHLQYTINAQGQVTDIQGLEEYIESLKSEGAKGSGARIEKNLFSKDSLKKMLPSSMCFLPSNPVKPGDHWLCKETTGDEEKMSIKADLTYTFAGWKKTQGKRCALLAVSGTIEVSMKALEEMAGMKSSLGPSHVTGKIWFDPEEGQPLLTQFHSKTINHMAMPKISESEKTADSPKGIDYEMEQNMETRLDKVE